VRTREGGGQGDGAGGFETVKKGEFVRGSAGEMKATHTHTHTHTHMHTHTCTCTRS
jgi:hypothetical protein